MIFMYPETVLPIGPGPGGTNIVIMSILTDNFEREKDVANIFEWFPYRLTFSEIKVRRK